MDCSQSHTIIKDYQQDLSALKGLLVHSSRLELVRADELVADMTDKKELLLGVPVNVSVSISLYNHDDNSFIGRFHRKAKQVKNIKEVFNAIATTWIGSVRKIILNKETVWGVMVGHQHVDINHRFSPYEDDADIIIKVFFKRE